MPEKPRVYKTEGIILRRRNLGEADTIFTVFSEHEGKFDGIARGVRKARSRMRGHLEPLTRSRLMLAQGRSLDVFTQAETLVAYRTIREDLERSALALYCAELVDRFAPEHIEQPGLYGLLVQLLDALEAGGPPHVARYFEVHLLSLMGYELQLDACAVCGKRLEPEEMLLSPAAGGFVCGPCRPMGGAGRLLGLRAVKVLRYARGATISEFAALRVDAALAAQLDAALTDTIRHILDREVLSGRFVDEVGRLPSVSAPPAGAVPSSTHS